MRLSPDGTRAALEIDSDGQTDVWVTEVSRGTLERITTNPADDTHSLWSPDGQRLLFVSTRSGYRELYWRSADGSGEAEFLTRINALIDVRLYFWTVDGDSVAVGVADPIPAIGMVSIHDGQWVPLVQTEASEYPAAISPDGDWIAYSSNVTGTFQVYLDRFPELGDRRVISAAGGFMPTWSSDGQELIYLSGRFPDRVPEPVMRVSVRRIDTEPPAPVVGEPERLFGYRYVNGSVSTRRTYDLSLDGERLLTITSDPESNVATDQVIFVQDWHQELLERVPIRVSR